MSIKTSFTNNSDTVRREFRKKVQLALKLIGEAAVGYATEDSPVDTGRLRNSLTYATATKIGVAGNSGANQPQDSTPRSLPPDNVVCIGTNVEYAKYVEFNEYANHDPPEHGGGKAHFLRDAVFNHTDEFKNVAETTLKTDR